MDPRQLWTLAALAAASLGTPAAASASVVKSWPTESATSGIALGADGNFWVSEPFATPPKVVRVSPAGAIVGSFTVGNSPATVIAGPGGRIWVAEAGSNRLSWFDAASPAPTAHQISTGGAGTCGPVALTAADDGRIYFSLPSDGACSGGISRLGSVAGDGSGAASSVVTPGAGTVYDLAATGGKLFAPDYENAQIRRYALGASLTVEATYPLPGSAQPDGITADTAGNLWITDWATGTIFKSAAAAASGSSPQAITPTGGALSNPYGIAVGGDGRIYVTGKASSNLLAIDPVTNATTFYALPQGEPWEIAKGADGSLWITDQSQTRVMQFFKDDPVVAAPPAESPPAPTPISAPAPARPAVPATPVLATKTAFTSRRTGSSTIVTKVKVSGLVGGETIKITCSKGCGFRTKTFKRLKGSSATYAKSLFRDRRLASGTKVTVAITKPGTVGNATTLTARKGKKATITSGCLESGSSKVTKC